MPGAPVFVPFEDSEVAKRKRAEEMKELEREWQKKKRPQDVSDQSSHLPLPLFVIIRSDNDTPYHDVWM